MRHLISENRNNKYLKPPVPEVFLAGMVFFVTVLIFLLPVSAETFRAEISPGKISQGDPFVVKVTGLEASSPPSAVLLEKEILFSGCGDGCYIALGGVDLNTKPGIYKVTVTAGREKRDLMLSVEKTAFPEIRLTLPKEKVFLSPEDIERTEREKERLTAIFRTITGKLWDGNFITPLGNSVSTGFGVKRIMNGKNVSVHKGVDIRGREGEEIRASNAGRVVLVEELFFGGNTVILDHGQGIYTIYMHLSKARVDSEDIVSKGDVIGLVGSSGRATGPHLHFAAKLQDMTVNPLSLISLAL